MNSLQEDRFFSEALVLEDPLTLLFVALAAFIGRLSYLLLGIYPKNILNLQTYLISTFFYVKETLKMKIQDTNWRMTHFVV